MRKIIYVLVVVSIAIVNTVFTIRNSDEIVDLVSLKSEDFKESKSKGFIRYGTYILGFAGI